MTRRIFRQFCALIGGRASLSLSLNQSIDRSLVNRAFSNLREADLITITTSPAVPYRVLGYSYALRPDYRLPRECKCDYRLQYRRAGLVSLVTTRLNKYPLFRNVATPDGNLVRPQNTALVRYRCVRKDCVARSRTLSLQFARLGTRYEVKTRDARGVRSLRDLTV